MNLRVAGANRFARFLGFVDARATTTGWMLAALVSVVFTAYAMVRFVSVRRAALSWSMLKLLGVVVAITAALCEEALFRKALMDWLSARAVSVPGQIAASAVAFGLLHGVWGLFRGSAAAAVGATVATGILGAALAWTYIVSGRVLAPCVVAHFLIDLAIEPGLMLAAVRGEMSSLA